MDCTKLVQDTVHWEAFLKTVMNIRFRKKVGNFLTSFLEVLFFLKFLIVKYLGKVIIVFQLLSGETCKEEKGNN